MFIVSRFCLWSSVNSCFRFAHSISYKVREKRIFFHHHICLLYLLERRTIWIACIWFSLFTHRQKRKEKGKGAKKEEEKAAPKEKKREQRKERKKERNSKVLASFVSLCSAILLLAWTKSETSLGCWHRLAWDYFSVLQFGIEIIAIPCYHIVPTQNSTYILLSAQVHLTTVTPKLDNWLCRLLALVRTLARRW